MERRNVLKGGLALAATAVAAPAVGVLRLA
jgi:hypothetical protein